MWRSVNLAMIAVTLVVFVVQLALWYGHLPNPMPSHFDAKGQVNGQMSLNAYYGVMAGLGMMVMVGFPVLAALSHRLPNSLINVSHKEYWLAPEQRKETINSIGTLLTAVGWMTGWLMIAVFQLTALVAIQQRATIGPEFSWLMGLYFAMVGGLLIYHLRRFRLPRNVATAACLAVACLMLATGCQPSTEAARPPLPPESPSHSPVIAPASIATAPAEIERPSVPVTESEPSQPMPQDPKPQDPKPQDPKPQDPEVEVPEVREKGASGGMLGTAGKLFEKAKLMGSGSADGAKQWVQGKLGEAAEAGGQSADASWQLANKTFESLKSQGLTTADSTSEWLGQDWNNMDAWEYKVLTLGGSDEDLSQQLNELGKQGWECFNTVSKTDGTQFFFKKQTFSYLRHMPFQDVIKLVPMMGGNAEK